MGIESFYHQFPLSGAINILKASYELQRFMIMQPTFINLTTDYKGLAKNITSTRWSPSPAMVVLVSSTFTLEEAILFWNLRAGDVPVAWLPLSELELDLKTVVSWLIKYLGGLLPALRAVPEVIFACPQDQVAHLQGKLTSQQLPQTWSFVPYDNLISYNYVRPFIKQEYVLVAGDDLSSTFVPPLPEEIRFEEMYAITMKWDGLMLPQDQKLIHDCVSQEEANYTVISRPLPQFRVTKDRWLRVQADAKIPIRFNKPSPEQIFQSLFSAAGFSHVEANDKAKYQLDFIHRAGSLEHAASYLTTQPYRKLFEILSDKKNRSRLAWRLKNPPGRLALPHHLLLSIVRGEPLSEKTEEFLRLSDHLPEEILSLLGREILERGFLLKCASCSFDAWYPVEKVGQRFECGRCFQTQVYRTNPAWVYKLREVVFQGFEQNIEIPLLALDYLRQKSSYYFKWLPEPNIIWSEHGKKKTRNLDILCMCDGKLYIGEAKNNDEIDADQMSFYESLTRRLHIDGLVFATSQPRWKTGVKTRIDQLKAKFDGVVLELTASELYPGVSTTL